MLKTASIKYVLILVGISLLFSCSKDSNPAVPEAPEGDVISIIERNPMIKVGLVSFSPQKHLYISVTRGMFKCYIGETLEPFDEGFSGDIFKFSGTENEIEYENETADEPTGLNLKYVRIEASDGAENGFIEIGDSKSNIRPYRGIIRLILEGKNILAVNELPLEDYLTGVVPAEMDPSWPEEALRAQAVASRTFALFNLGRYEGRGFDIADDERSQDYGGVAVETERTTNVVIDTIHQVIVYDNVLACACFHKESIGKTADNLDVWPYSEDVPYLAEITEKLGDFDYSIGGNYEHWSNWASFDELKAALNRDGETFIGEYLSSISLLGVSENGRVQSIDLDGEKSNVVDPQTLGHVLNRNLRADFLPSNFFTITLEGNGYRFTGAGSGHGVGMNQWGAYNRASNGQEYRFILAEYYPGTEVKEIPVDGINVLHNVRLDRIR